MFRLHIDIPLAEDEEESAKIAKSIADELVRQFLSDNVKKIQYRMANDEERAVRNYLIKDDEGHCSTKKIVVKHTG